MGPSGTQWDIFAPSGQAVVTEVGGTLRTLSLGGVDILDGFGEDAMCDGARGSLLMPWPNRIADGTYVWEGEPRQLPLSEAARRNAIHGLVRWEAFKPLNRAPGRLMLGHRIFPRPGYPFAVDLEVQYVIGDQGLAVSIRATNTGSRPCPFAFGQHPYLAPGPGPVDNAVLELRANAYLTTDDRQIPTGNKDVASTPFDFRRGRKIGDAKIDTAFTDLERSSDGRVHVRLTRTDDHVVELWGDSSIRVIQVFTGDTLAPERRRRGLAVEPMTAPANAFRTEPDTVTLEPGATRRVRWGLSLLR